MHPFTSPEAKLPAPQGHPGNASDPITAIRAHCRALVESGPLRLLYDERKAYEAGRVETPAHAHNRAKRYIEKRLIRDLWRAWRAA